MAFTSLNQVIAALPGQMKSFAKASITSKAGSYADLANAAGNPGAIGTPAAYGSGGTLFTEANGIRWLAPGGGLKAYLARMVAAGAGTAGTLILYDRIWGCTGMSGTVTTAQTIASFPGLPARAGTGENIEAWVEWYTATGSTAVNVTFTYTNSANVAGRTGVQAFITSPAVNQMFALPMAQGDVGVKVPTSIQLSATTGTAGAFGVTLLRRLVEIPILASGVSTSLDVFALGLPKVEDDTCLQLMALCSGTTTGAVGGNFSLISG